jgi:hypothetical protein
MEDVRTYFEDIEGTGVLATSDVAGNVNTALYAKPHFMDDGTVAFIMAEHRSYHNLKSNPRASYLFMETHPKEKSHEGKRLYLAMVREEQNDALISSLRRHSHGEGLEGRHLVFFEIVGVRPLVGG